MISKNDIYAHLKHGGTIEELYSALDHDIEAAMEQIAAEEQEAEEAAKKAETLDQARKQALAALVNYVTIAGQSYSEEELSKLLTFLADSRIVFGTTPHLFSSWF